MVKCVQCGTGWTSSGLPICPVCGTKVEAAPEGKPLSEVSVRKKGSAVLAVPVEPRVEATPKEKPVEIETVDASGVHLPVQAPRVLPTATRPLNGPIILGCLAYVAVVLLPLTLAFEGHRVVGVLGFSLAGFFAPFAPIAWLVGMSAESRRRDQGLRPERRVTLGRQLGQWGTVLLVTQTTLGLVAIAALRLSAKFPPTFWRGEF